jgi:streptomycin 6-kinase
LKRWFRELFQKAALDKSEGLNSTFTRAAPLAEHLLNQNREVRVLHGDIHHENIRHHPERGYLAFDPKGLIGERTFDAANTLCNPVSMGDVVRNEARILRISGILAGKMGIEQSRVLGFVYIYACLSASWIESDGSEAQDELTIAELVEPHIAHLTF